MSAGEIGLFPLDLVLVPGEDLPLHIFEDRYKDLVGRSLDDGSGFGVVLADADGMRKVGTEARVAEVTSRYPDGRLDIVARGESRFAVVELTEGHSFASARIDPFDDDDPDTSVEMQIDECVTAYLALADEVGADTTELDRSLPVSFQIIALVDLGTAIKQEFLELRSERERLHRLAIALQSARDAVARQNEITRKASSNGHIVTD